MHGATLKIGYYEYLHSLKLILLVLIGLLSYLFSVLVKFVRPYKASQGVWLTDRNLRHRRHYIYGTYANLNVIFNNDDNTSSNNDHSNHKFIRNEWLNFDQHWP